MGIDLENYRKLKSGYQYLDDLRHFGSSESTPVIDQVASVLDQLWGLVENEKRDISRLSIVEDLIKQEIRSQLKTYLYGQTPIKELQLNFEETNYRVETWEKVLISINEGIRVIEAIGSSDFVELLVDADRVQFYSKLGARGYSEETRTAIYQSFRKLIQNYTLMSYQVEELDSGEAAIRVTIDYSHNEIKWTTFACPEKKVFLKLSNAIWNYRVKDFSNIRVNGSGILLNKNFEVESVAQMNSEFLTENFSKDSNTEVFHFPFIFRPIWLIIPFEGKIREASSMDDWKSLDDQDWNESISQKLDFFKLLSE